MWLFFIENKNENYNLRYNLCYIWTTTELQPTQQTQNICITFVQRRPNVFDVGPALYKCYTHVLCLLGNLQPELRTELQPDLRPELQLK